jgi:hypothetical protein
MTVGARQGLVTPVQVLSAEWTRTDDHTIAGSLMRIAASTAPAHAAGFEARGPHAIPTELGLGASDCDGLG